MESKLQILIQSFGKERVSLNQDLKSYTFNKIAKKAACFYTATSTKELVKILNACFDLKLPFSILGAGTKFALDESLVSAVVIKNRTSGIKINSFKGKVGRGGLGINEALIEVDSGISVGKLKEYLKNQNLQDNISSSPNVSTIGGSIFIDQELRLKTKEIKVWDKGEEESIALEELSRNFVVLSIIFRFKTILK